MFLKGSQGAVSEADPVNGGHMAVKSGYDGGTPPAIDGHIGPPRDAFFWGSDPAFHPLRPVPTQVDSVRVSGRIYRIYDVQPLRFRFMQAWWDAFNTLHWGMTGSETSKIQLQVARYLDANTRTEFGDIRPENAAKDQATGYYLIDPWCSTATGTRPTVSSTPPGSTTS